MTRATDKAVKDRIVSMLNRPLMYTASCETLEVCVLQLSWALTGNDFSSTFTMWYVDKLRLKRDVPIWRQREYLIDEYAHMLRDFLRHKGVLND